MCYTLTVYVKLVYNYPGYNCRQLPVFCNNTYLPMLIICSRDTSVIGMWERFAK